MAARKPGGAELEQEFAAFMKSDLSFTKATCREKINPGHLNSAFEFDVHGVVYDRSVWLMLVLAFVGGLTSTGLAIHDPNADRILVGAMLLGSCYAFKGMLIEHTWVECKDQKKNTPTSAAVVPARILFKRICFSIADYLIT